MRSRDQLRPIAAFVCAVGLHGLGIGLVAKQAISASSRSTVADRTSSPFEIDVTRVELSAAEEVDQKKNAPAKGATGRKDEVASVNRRRGDEDVRVAAEHSEVSSAPGLVFGENDSAPSAEAEGEGRQGVEPRRPVDLGLNGALTRSLVLEQRGRPPPHREPSAGLLEEGLAALDGERGMARSSPILSEAKGVAVELAPREGSAIFEVTVDAQGLVFKVVLVSFDAEEEKWRRVASRMRARLRGRKVRVPSGSRGLFSRIRVARGDVAKDVGDLFRTKRGVALGQKPLSPKQTFDESTQATDAPGRLAPVLGVSTERDIRPTRVALLLERVL